MCDYGGYDFTEVKQTSNSTHIFVISANQHVNGANIVNVYNHQKLSNIGLKAII